MPKDNKNQQALLMFCYFNNLIYIFKSYLQYTAQESKGLTVNVFFQRLAGAEEEAAEVEVTAVAGREAQDLQDDRIGLSPDS